MNNQMEEYGFIVSLLAGTPLNQFYGLQMGDGEGPGPGAVPGPGRLAYPRLSTAP
jgi:hypothetical protein